MSRQYLVGGSIWSLNWSVNEVAVNHWHTELTELIILTLYSHLTNNIKTYD